MPVASVAWAIPADAPPQTCEVASGSSAQLTEQWAIYVGPLRRGQGRVAIAPPDLDFDAQVWPIYPVYALDEGAEMCAIAPATGKVSQPESCALRIVQIVYTDS